LIPCCVSDDSPMINGTTYECAHPTCAGEGETYSVTTPCCDGYVESEIVLTTGDFAKICVTAPTLGVDALESAAPLFYRSQGCESIVVEAERLMLSGDFEVRNELHGYAFGGYIEYDGESSGAKFDVRGVYEYGSIEFRFRSTASTVMHLLVNGVPYDVMFHATSGDDWDTVSVAVAFDSDITLLNRVLLEQAGDVVSPMIDRIQIKGACAPEEEFQGVFNRKCDGGTYTCSSPSEAEAVCNAEGMTLCSQSQIVSAGPTFCAYMWTSSSSTHGYYVGFGTNGCGTRGALQKTSVSYNGARMFDAACCQVEVTQYHYVGPGYCRSNDCQDGDCQVQGYYKQSNFEYTADFDSLPDVRRQKSVREPNMFVSSDAECKAQCDSDDSCVGYSIADEDYEFPGRCIVHVTDTSNMPAVDWRPLERDSTDIVFSSRDDGVHCYSKIVVCPDTCNGETIWFDCDGDGIADPTCYDNGFSVQLSSSACKVSTSCSVSIDNSYFDSVDSMCLTPYGESDLENNINAYCMGVEYTPERIDPKACDASETFLVKLALANTMFKECDSLCLYDVYEPDAKAYVWIEDLDCWDSLWNNDAATQDCFQNNDDEFEFAIQRVEQFCSGEFECMNKECDTSTLVEDIDYAVVPDVDCVSCAAVCENYLGFECTSFECDVTVQSGQCTLYKDEVCTEENSTPSLSTIALCLFKPYFPEIETVSYGEIKINFQPSYVDAPDGYYVDSGEKFKLHDNGYSYGWRKDVQGNVRDRNGLGTVDSTLMINDGEWMIALPEGKYNVEVGYSDPANDVQTTHCSVGAVTISVGTVAAGETASTHINVEIESDLLYVSGFAGSGCDSFSYIIVRSGWVETGYELGIPDSNKCYGSQSKIESYAECAAAAQSFGMHIANAAINNQNWPTGCSELSNEAYFNEHSTGGTMGTPICKRTHTLMIRQTITSEVWTRDALEVNSDDPDNDNYAILNQLEQFRSSDGKFYFKLTWPNANEDVTMEWSQTSNPLVEDVVGYEPIDVPYTGRGWGGLEPSSQALMDGSVLGSFKSNWFYAVGAYNNWPTGSDKLPGYAKADNDNSYAQTQVELYVQKKQGVVAQCPDGYSQVGTLSENNDIVGTGLGQSQQNSITDCKDRCDQNANCVAFMYGGANEEEASTLCELSRTVTPNNDWGTNFRFCKKTGCSQSFVLGMNVYAHMSGLYTETSTKFNDRPVYEHESGNHWILARETSSLDLQWVLNFGGIDNEWTVSDYANSRNEDYPWLASWPDGETFTLGTNCDGSNDAGRRQMEMKEFSTLKNRLINLQN